MKHRCITIGLAALLTSAVALILYGETRPLNSAFRLPPSGLKGLLPDPAGLPGWKVEFRPIAETPEMQKAVAEILNYDDTVFAIYIKADLRISVYMAYWQAGKMPHRLVASHTPDVCWVGQGWTCAERRVNDSLTLANGTPILPAEERRMTWGVSPPSAVLRPPSSDLRPQPSAIGSPTSALRHPTSVLRPPSSTELRSEWVLFWHLVGGEVQSYGTGGRPPWHAVFSDLWRQGIDQRAEQFFVRISSNDPVTGWGKSDIIQQLAANLPLTSDS